MRRPLIHPAADPYRDPWRPPTVITVADPSAPRPLTGLARRRADARPLSSAERGLHSIAVIALWCSAWLVLGIAVVWPRTGFATMVAPWLVPLLIAAALAWMESRTVRGRRIYGPAHTAVGPLSAFTVLAVATTVAFGAPAHLVAWIAASSLCVALTIYVVIGALVRTPARKRPDREVPVKEIFFFVLVFLQLVVLAVRLVVVAAVLLGCLQ